MLKKAGALGAGLATAPLIAACAGTGGSAKHANGAHDVSGSFSWKKAKGTTLRLLQTPHAYQQTYQPLLKDFTELTGIHVQTDLVAEADYFTKLNTELAGGSGAHDVFMTGAYFIWTYGPPGWMENLKPWLSNPSATSPDYDFEDIYPFLRADTSWDFVNGHPLGSGGQYAIPWGWETNIIAYNKSVFAKKGIKPPETFGDLMDVAVHLTNRSQNQYGIAFRGSKSWATIHPGYMTGFSRMGAKDYDVSGGKLTAAMNSPQGTEFTNYWAELAKKAGPTGWTSYEYPDCTRDLGNGTAMMCWDADSATYPKNLPGASKEAGNIAWYPGPKGPNGSLATNLWTWSLAINAASKNKLAAWLFIQWATGKEAMTKAVKTGTMADPTRKSVLEGPFRASLGKFPGYLDAFEAIAPQTSIKFTPQKQFFDTTQNWAVALQNIYDGASAKPTMNALAKSSTNLIASNNK